MTEKEAWEEDLGRRDSLSLAARQSPPHHMGQEADQEIGERKCVSLILSK